MAAKILIADDEPNILLSLEFLMKKQGYNVLIARDGGEAYDLIISEKPDVILLDVMMPRMNGHELCRFVKNTDSYKHARVVFLSAKSKEAHVRKGYEAGADLYLTKPFSTRGLVAKVGELAAQSNQS